MLEERHRLRRMRGATLPAAAAVLAVVLVAMAAAPAYALSSGVQVFDVSQPFIHFHGRDIVTITGTGFKTYGSVVCEWLHTYQSTRSEIVDDNTIVCQSPRIVQDALEDVPFFGELNIYFDGNKVENRVLVAEDFRVGPAFTGFEPRGGLVAGGEWVIVRGTGFDDFSSAEILFDGVPCTEGVNANGEVLPVIEGDGELRCHVPPGEFSQDAVVEVRFDNNPLRRYRLDGVYEYGPRLTGAVPPCSLLRGGSPVTLVGERMTDPITRDTLFPVRVELIVGDPVQRRFFGRNVTVNEVDGSVTFITPDLEDELRLGIAPLVQLFYGRDSNAVTLDPEDSFTYGPSVTSAANGAGGNLHIGGGDRLVVSGCALESVAAGDYSIRMSNGTDLVELCDRGTGPGSVNDTLRVISNGDNLGLDRLECVTRGFDRCDGVRGFAELHVEARNLDVPSLQPTVANVTGFLAVTVGPAVVSITPQRGPRFGGEKVTILGGGFLLTGAEADAAWAAPTVRFVADDVSLEPVQPISYSDSQIVVLTPEGRFALETQVEIDYGTGAGEPQCSESDFGTYVFGPVCTGFTPTFGPLSGEAPVRVSGHGFTEEGASVADTEVRFCLRRLNPDGTRNCRAFEESKTTRVTDTEIHSETPSHRQNVQTIVGSNRLFGDEVDVYVHFLTPDSSGRDYNRQLLAPGLDVAAVKCPGVYEFGPRVESFSPTAAPNGPFRPDSRRVGREPTVVHVHGEYFDDEAYFSQHNGSFVSFGAHIGESKIVSSTQIDAVPLPGHNSNEEVQLSVTFAPECNVTHTGVTVTWGPIITGVSVVGLPSAWGVNPRGSVIAISGTGFQEFVQLNDELEEQLVGRCVIDGQPVATSYDAGDIVCETPEVPFGTELKVGVEFGTDCSDATSPIDWRNYVEAPTSLWAAPRIDSISPEFGPVSGATPVVISGQGFSGFSEVECVFGGYSTPGVIVSDSSVSCSSPRTRGEFGTDVVVALVMDGEPTYKVCEGFTFHYGPVCTAIAPASCDTVGCSAQVVGSGFQDCFVQDVEPIRNCAFRDYIVEMVHPVTGEVIALPAPTNDTLADVNSDTHLVFEVPPVDFCGDADVPRFQIRFPDTPIGTAGLEQRTVQCVAPGGGPAPFGVGPVVTGFSGEFQEDGTVYGWEGDLVSVSGNHFLHAASHVTCVFRGEGGGATVTAAADVRSDSLLECRMPKNAFDAYTQLSVRWSGPGSPAECEREIGAVHWGPVLRGSSPARGYVTAQTPITISGFGFGCCGIQDLECVMPDAVNENIGRPSDNEVVCLSPANTNVDSLLAGFGVRFTSVRFTESPRNVEQLTNTEAAEDLRFFYGPVVHDISPTRVALSARDERITITGEGFADPHFSDVFCDFFSQTGAVDLLGEIKVEIPDKTDTTIVCDVREFARTCGDYDLVRPRWRRVARDGREEQGKFYFRTEASEASAAVFTEPTIVDGGSVDKPTFAASSLWYRPAFLSATSVQTRSNGGTEMTVFMTNLRDWRAEDDARGDFGPGVAMCRFGDVHSELVPLRVQHADVPDTVYPSNFTCVTPSAPFGYSAPLSIILNPPTATVEGSNRPFRWTAHALDISRRWGSEFGREVVVVRGRGFCKYPAASCYFGHREALQTEITSDHSITCVSPPHAPAHVPLTVRLCADEECSVEDEIRPVNVNTDFTYVGVTSIFPQQGPVCGDTLVTASGFGFRFFDEVRCVFNGHERAAKVLSDNTVQCLSPDLSSEFDPDDNNVFCVPFEVLGLRNGARYLYRSPADFEYGFPQVTAVSPAAFDIDDAPVRLEISGTYLNGGDVQNGTYRCLFGPYKTRAAIILGENDDDDLDTDTQVLCHTPPRDVLQVGTYTVEVRYECDHNEEFTYNRFPVQVTQEPRIVSISPKQGAELGGTDVTITGDDFNGGTLYLCAFGDVFAGDYVAVQGQFRKGLKFPTASISALPSTEDSLSAVDDDDDELSRFRRADAHHRAPREVQGFDDQIVCQTPFYSVDRGTHVPVAISIDGGKTWTHSPDRFYYQNVGAIDDGDQCSDLFATTRTQSVSPASAIAPAFAGLVALLALLLM